MECIITRLYGSLAPANLESRFEARKSRSVFLKGRQTPSNKMVGPLAYIGGKNRVANKIIELFPKHSTYVEAFAGGAQVFCHKKPSAVEVLNDKDGEIVNFFRVCQSHHEEFLRCLKYCLVSRKLFDLAKAQNPDTLTDVQRATRFFY